MIIPVMTKHLFLYLSTALLLLLCGCRQGPSCAPAPLRVMTFNIRLDVASDSLNAWPHRKDNVGKLLAYYAPDLLGMQEVLPNQMRDLKQLLPQYTALGVGRDDGKDRGEYSPVFYRTERFDLLESGSFSLSQQPDSFGVLGWDAACNRVCSWALLRDKQTGRKVAYFNTHLDHIGVTARREGSRLVLERLKQIAPGLPAIITGDFNCTPDDEPAHILGEGGMLNAWTSADVAYGPDWSFHDFGRLPLEKRPLLDYVFFTPQLKATRCRVIQDTPAEGYYSDHCPVMADLTFLNQQ